MNEDILEFKELDKDQQFVIVTDREKLAQYFCASDEDGYPDGVAIMEKTAATKHKWSKPKEKKNLTIGQMAYRIRSYTYDEFIDEHFADIL